MQSTSKSPLFSYDGSPDEQELWQDQDKEMRYLAETVVDLVVRYPEILDKVRKSAPDG